MISLESELLEHKQQASNAKNKYADWNTELQKKLKELREEKKSWFLEAAALRTAQKETQVSDFRGNLNLTFGGLIQPIQPIGIVRCSREITGGCGQGGVRPSDAKEGKPAQS